MSTEEASPRYENLDAWGDLDILKALFEGQLAAVASVGPALAPIAAAAAAAVPRLRGGGRLVYVGAGTSGRLGVQDGVELTPTFDWPEERVLHAIAGGDAAILRSVENAEDSVEAGAAAMAEAGLGPRDVVVAVAASGRTPFTLAAVRAARAAGALTIGVANNPGSELLGAAEHGVLVETGEEAIAGSTRMKAGTAQKIVLNLFSTLLMVRMGRVYRGLMVDMRLSNAKLRRRARDMVRRIAGCDAAIAAAALERAGGDLKLAALVASGADLSEARALLTRHGGNLRKALENF